MDLQGKKLQSVVLNQRSKEGTLQFSGVGVKSKKLQHSSREAEGSSVLEAGVDSSWIFVILEADRNGKM